ATGGGNHAGPGWPKPRLLGHEDSNGGLQGVGIGAGVRYVSPVAGAPDNTLKVPGYALFDAALFYNVGRHWRLALNGTNLANREVISGCYDATRCIYANGRTVLASAKYAW
ncbi:TonB-dependent receptor, partial [Ralstonia solanacearum]